MSLFEKFRERLAARSTAEAQADSDGRRADSGSRSSRPSRPARPARPAQTARASSPSKAPGARPSRNVLLRRESGNSASGEDANAAESVSQGIAAGSAAGRMRTRALGATHRLRAAGDVITGRAFPKVTGTADVILAAAMIALLFFGVVMVYSASATLAARNFDNGYHYLIRQGVYACGGLVLMVVLARIDYHRYQASYVTYPILMGAFALLMVVALGGGRTVGGAARWIDLGVIRVQPAEIAKLAIIFYLSYSLSKKSEQLRDFKIGFLPHVIVAGVFMLLCLKQPDFGSAVMIGLLTVVLLFTAGTKVNYILGSAGIALPIVYMLITGSAYRMRRIEAFLNPFADRAGVGYQIAESLISFAQGGVFGVGIGDSLQKLAYLPEAHTDFISAIVGEELGLIGVGVLLLTFVLIVYRGLHIAISAADDYGTYLATGVTLFVGLQAFTNLSVALGLLPTKGLTLPFVSYGGSSLLVNSAAIGLLLNVSRPREVVPVDAEEDASPANTSKTKEPKKKASGRAKAAATPSMGNLGRGRRAMRVRSKGSVT